MGKIAKALLDTLVEDTKKTHQTRNNRKFEEPKPKDDNLMEYGKNT